MKAIVIGASGGIGGAVVACLHRDSRFTEVETLSRSVDGFDMTDEVTVRAAVERFRQDGQAFDLIFDATGALTIGGTGPEKTIRALDPEAMMRQFLVNAVGPALLLKHFHGLLPKDRRGVMATLSARVGSISDNRLGGWISYRAAKAALNQIVRTAAIEIARSHPAAVVVGLHPGTVETTLSEPFRRGHTTITPSQCAESLLAVLEQLQPEQSGGFFAYDGNPIGW